MRIGVIGRGFVGGSIDKFINEQHGYSTLSYDLKDSRDMNIAYDRIVRQCDFIYVCLPTPMDNEGKCHTGIVRGCLKLLSFYSNKRNKETVVLIKSTMVPNTSKSLQKDFPNLTIVTNPEFLTERTAYEDMVNAKTHVLGVPKDCDKGVVESLQRFHKNIWPDAEVYIVSNTEAELIKYMTNTFYALKVTYANHIYELAQVLDVDYGKFIESAIASDPRLGDIHWNVPGPDGNFGFGGKCFPKDLNGMIKLFEENNLNCDLLKSVWEYNSNVREQKDWLKILGAVI